MWSSGADCTSINICPEEACFTFMAYIICETYKYLTFLYARIQMKKVNININGQCKSASVYSVSGGDTRENDGAVTRTLHIILPEAGQLGMLG